MLTKKDLEEKYELSANTVYKTLQVCGLGTSSKEYSEEEVEQFFAPARKMLDAGKTYKDVEEFFGTKKPNGAGEVEQEEFDAAGFAANEADDVADGMTMATAESMARMVQRSVKEIAPFIPALINQAINQEMQEGGAIKEAFNTHNQQVREGKRLSSGAQFLMGRLRQGKKAHQLNGMQGQHLLEASIEPSEENSNESSEN